MLIIIVPELVYNYYIIKNKNKQTIFNKELYEENSENENEQDDYMEYKIILSENDSESEDIFINKKISDNKKDKKNIENEKENKKTVKSKKGGKKK